MRTITYGHGKVENFSAFVETGLLLADGRCTSSGKRCSGCFSARCRFGRACWRSAFWAWPWGLTCVRSRALARVARAVRQRGAGSRRAAFFDRRVEHVGGHSGHRRRCGWASAPGSPGCATPIRWPRWCVAAVVIWVGSAARASARSTPCWTRRRRVCRSACARAVQELEGVLSAERVRVRRAGNRHFVDVTISVPRAASFEQVHAISDAVERRVGRDRAGRRDGAHGAAGAGRRASV